MTTISAVAPTGRLLTVDLFRDVQACDSATDLVAVGLALHHLTELVGDLVDLSPFELHRATTILTKQTVRLLAADDSLEAIRDLMTDPARIATVDGHTVAELCGDAWPSVLEAAAFRADSAVEFAKSFGATAVLHLAATRAVRPRLAWWGTDTWSRRITAWIDETLPGPRLRATAIAAPEDLADEVLARVLAI